MADLIVCPTCQGETAVLAIYCWHCGVQVSDVPAAITRALIDDLADDQLINAFDCYVDEVLKSRGCYSNDGPPDREVLAELPRGVRAAWTLRVLDAEVNNGGFYQWFTNSSGQTTDLALEDLRLIGANQQAALIERAIALNRELEQKYLSYARRWERPEPEHHDRKSFRAYFLEHFEPRFDRLDDEYYHLDDTDSLFPRLVSYIRSHAEECLHERTIVSPPAERGPSILGALYALAEESKKRPSNMD
jgi:hypothetical protein